MANAAPAACCAIPVGRMVVLVGGWLGTKRSLTLRVQRSSGTPTDRRTASFPGQAVPAEDHTIAAREDCAVAGAAVSAGSTTGPHQGAAPSKVGMPSDHPIRLLNSQMVKSRISV